MDIGDALVNSSSGDEEDGEQGLLENTAVARQWHKVVSGVYDPAVTATFWPPALQRRLLSQLSLTEDDHVLDIGCGTGKTSDRLATQAGTVDALDLSHDQVDRARQSTAEARFLRGKPQHLPYADDTFDAVVSVGAIIYVTDPGAALAEAYRVTRPGGRLLVAGFNRPSLPSPFPVENVATVTNETFFFTWDDDEARDQCTEAGWENVETAVDGPVWHKRLARVVTAEKPE